MDHEQNGTVNTLDHFLIQRNYSPVPLNRIFLPEEHTETSVLLISQMEINGVEGTFLVDTGASVSMIGKNAMEKFNLKLHDRVPEIEAYGAGPGALENVTLSETCQIRWGTVQLEKNMVIMPIEHINRLLLSMDVELDGIIGSDLLLETGAVIDYGANKLYIKP